MKFVSAPVLSLAFLIGFSVSGAEAQSLAGADEPAEFPPSSFTGSQYVDSRGCVFIRAGIDGNVTWVPRVQRNRKVICGFQPSLSKTQLAAIAADRQPAAAAPAPLEITLTPEPEPAPKAVVKPAPKVAAVPKPAPKPVVKAPVRRVVKTAPKPAPKPATKPAAIMAQAPMKTIASAPTQPATALVPETAPATAPKTLPASAVPTCTNASPFSQRFINDGSVYEVRCGPQADFNSFSSARTRTVRAVGPAPATAQTTVPRAPATASDTVLSAAAAPAMAPARTLRAAPAMTTPKGFRSAWTDDRLNPQRGGQTAEGKAQMDLVWTETVPRRLVDRASGTDVTRNFPKLYYPYTSYDRQQLALANGAKIVPRRTVTSTKAAAKAAPAKTAPAATIAAAGKKYVQVGTFGVPSNAQRTAQRLQRSGLPVRIGQYSKGGKNYQVVLAGPFASQTRLGQALKAVRGAGFGDAFLR